MEQLNMAYKRKTEDVWVVLGNYGYGHGWEAVTEEAKYQEGKQRLKEYRENEPQFSHKLVCRRRKLEMQP